MSYRTSIHRNRLARLIVLFLVVTATGVPALAQDGEGHPAQFYRQALEVHSGLHGRGYLGVEMLDLTAELQRHFKAPEATGVLIARVAADSPAAAAGLAVGDVVYRIDGEPIGRGSDLAAAVRGHGDGDEVTVEVIRGGTSLDLTVTLAERERVALELDRRLRWQQEDDGPARLFWLPKEGERFVLPEANEFLHVDPEALEELRETLEGVDWPDYHTLHSEAMEERMKELERRLEELSRKLEEQGDG